MTVALTPRKIAGYGARKDLPDHRDISFKPKYGADQVPGAFSLAAEMPPIWDQSQEGSCTAHGWARIFLHRAMKEGLLSADDTPSRQFIYQNELIAEGTFPNDSGAEVRTGAKVVSSIGVPLETLWPYDLGSLATKPPQSVYDQAKVHEGLQYQRVQVGGPGAPMRSALFEGLPIVLGFPVPDYFEDRAHWDPASGQPLPVPDASTSIIGGHCVAITGYDFTGREFEPYFELDNSWGPAWGMNGRFRMHYHWFTQQETLASDMWVLQRVS